LILQAQKFFLRRSIKTLEMLQCSAHIPFMLRAQDGPAAAF
jgi:hypothetical protein